MFSYLTSRFYLVHSSRIQVRLRDLQNVPSFWLQYHWPFLKFLEAWSIPEGKKFGVRKVSLISAWKHTEFIFTLDLCFRNFLSNGFLMLMAECCLIISTVWQLLSTFCSRLLTCWSSIDHWSSKFNLGMKTCSPSTVGT